MADAHSTLDLLRLLGSGGDESRRFDADAAGWLAEHSWADTEAADLIDALDLGWSSVELPLVTRLAPPSAVDPREGLADSLAHVLAHDPEPDWLAGAPDESPLAIDPQLNDFELDDPEFDDLDFGTASNLEPGTEELKPFKDVDLNLNSDDGISDDGIDPYDPNEAALEAEPSLYAPLADFGIDAELSPSSVGDDDVD